MPGVAAHVADGVVPGWVVVTVGQSRFAGYATVGELVGAPMLRLEIPAPPNADPDVEPSVLLLNPAKVASIHPCDAEVARRHAGRLARRW